MPQRMRIIALVLGLLAVMLSLAPRLAATRFQGNHEGYEPIQPIAYSHRLHAGEMAMPCLYCHFGAEKSRHAGIPPANVCMNCHASVFATMGQKLAARQPLEKVVEDAKAAVADAEKAEAAPERVAELNVAVTEAEAALLAFKPNTILSDALKPLFAAVGFDPKQAAYDPDAPRTPIRWKQVHRLPDYVFFDHRAHVGAGVDCQRCHGPVESMERVRQFNNLSMGWCLNCHRDVRAHGVKGKPVSPSTNCSACHY